MKHFLLDIHQNFEVFEKLSVFKIFPMTDFDIRELNLVSNLIGLDCFE